MVMAGTTTTFGNIATGFTTDRAAIDLRAPDQNGVEKNDLTPIPEFENSGVAHQKIPGSVDMKSRVQILPNKPLPQFDTPCAQAFEASINSDLNRKCLAMVIKPGMPARQTVIESVCGVGLGCTMSVVDYGPVDWPLTGDKRMAVIMDRPTGEKFLPKDAHSFPKLSEAEIMKFVAIPMTATLRQFANRNQSFRGINLYNMYWEDNSKQRLVFGDCYTFPPGYLQPVFFESLVSAMCDPTARGESSIAEDLFSFGALLLCLSIGKNPLADKNDDWIINARIEQGSYNLYTGQYPIPAVILEAVRGLLADDPIDRWGIEDLEAWVRGSRQTGKPYRSQRHASRPFLFAEKEFLFVPSLVYALVRNWSKAGEVIRNKSLDSWLRRSLSDEKMADDVAHTINPSGPTSKNIPDDVLISRTCIALDRDGPLRYRSFSGRIEGIGAALAMAQGDNERLSLIMQMIQSKLPITWLNFQGREYKNFSALTLKFESLPLVTEHKQPGFGLERALYELNPQLPCLSPILKDHYITTPNELLIVLDRMGGSGNHPTMPFDRHIAAFVAARMSEAKDSDFRPLGPPADQATQIIGQMNLLVKMQRICRVRELHGLSMWCMKMIQPAINKFRNVKRRKRIMDAVTVASKTGLISDMLQFTNNENELAMDELGFKRAAMEHAVITLRIASLEQLQKQQHEIAKLRGEQAAVSLASILALFFMTAIFYLYIKTL